VNATHPLAKLTNAEAALLASIDAATARLEAVGTSSLDAALERLRSAAHAASARLAEAGLTVASLAGDVLEGRRRGCAAVDHPRFARTTGAGRAGH